jgi:hypothetical protein
MPNVLQCRGHSVNLGDVYFEPMSLGARALGIRLLVPDISFAQIKYARAALRKVVLQILEERGFAQIIQAIEVTTLTDSPGKYIALGDLGSFMHWWEARRRHARPRCACNTFRRVPSTS